MAARKKSAKKKSAKKKPARRRGGTKRPARRAPARKSGGKKKAAGKKGGKKKTTKKKTAATSTPHIVIVSGGRALPGTLRVGRGDTVQWVNHDGVGYTIHFDESPFLNGRKSQDIAVAAGAPTAIYTVHKTKPKGSYGYDLVGSKAATPPGEPQVTVEG